MCRNILSQFALPPLVMLAVVEAEEVAAVAEAEAQRLPPQHRPRLQQQQLPPVAEVAEVEAVVVAEQQVRLPEQVARLRQQEDNKHLPNYPTMLPSGHFRFKWASR